jgi:hypothetical protein
MTDSYNVYQVTTILGCYNGYISLNISYISMCSLFHFCVTEVSACFMMFYDMHMTLLPCSSRVSLDVVSGHVHDCSCYLLHSFSRTVMTVKMVVFRVGVVW